jgi:hypothetical protein
LLKSPIDVSLLPLAWSLPTANVGRINVNGNVSISNRNIILTRRYASIVKTPSINAEPIVNGINESVANRMSSIIVFIITSIPRIENVVLFMILNVLMRLLFIKGAAGELIP